MISHCTHETVFHVVRHMRAADRQEIYATRWDENPFLLTADVMTHSNFAWVGWHADKPCAVGGAAALSPGVFSMFFFATDDLPRIGLLATRFSKKTVIPTLFGQMAARRLQCDSHEAHADAHRWLTALGFRREGVRKALGKDGADFITWVCLAPKLDKTDITC